MPFGKNFLDYIWNTIEKGDGKELEDLFRYFDYSPEFCFPELSHRMYNRLGAQVLNMVRIKKKKVKYAQITKKPGVYTISFWIDRRREIRLNYIICQSKSLPKLHDIKLRDFLGDVLYALERPFFQNNLVWSGKDAYSINIPYEP